MGLTAHAIRRSRVVIDTVKLAHDSSALSFIFLWGHAFTVLTKFCQSLISIVVSVDHRLICGNRIITSQPIRLCRVTIF